MRIDYADGHRASNAKAVLGYYGIAVTLVWSGLVTFVLLKVIAFFIPLRVTDQEELMGLDIALHGESIHS